MASIGLDLGTRRSGFCLAPAGGEPLVTTTLTRGNNESIGEYSERVADRVVELANGAKEVVVAIDAPIFPPGGAIRRRPIEATFQRKPFSNNRRWAGVQPNNPEGIRETVKLGELVVSTLSERLGVHWYANPVEHMGDGRLIVEAYPTLALALLAPLAHLIERREWFSLYGKPYALMRALEAARDAGRLDALFPPEVRGALTDEELLQKCRDKDDVAAITAAFLGDLLLKKNASVFWCASGHYVLPGRDLWHADWYVSPAPGVQEVA